MIHLTGPARIFLVYLLRSSSSNGACDGRLEQSPKPSQRFTVKSLLQSKGRWLIRDLSQELPMSKYFKNTFERLTLGILPFKLNGFTYNSLLWLRPRSTQRSGNRATSLSIPILGILENLSIFLRPDIFLHGHICWWQCRVDANTCLVRWTEEMEWFGRGESMKNGSLKVWK